MSPQDSTYPLVEPSEVDVSAIESELEEIWRCCAEAEGGTAVMRAAAFTMIYAARGPAGGHDISDMLVELSLRHPSRAILLYLDDKAESPSFKAWVTVYCQRPSPSASPVCSDFITLEAAHQEISAVVSTLFSLFCSGLPTVLAWDNSLPPDHPVLQKLGTELERVIVSTIPPCAPASRLSALFKLTDALGEKPIVTDLSECFVESWRLAVARLFDFNPSASQQIREIRISYNGDKIPAEMLLLAAWLSVVLQWSPRQRFTLRGHSPSVVFDGEHIISFHSQSGPDAKEIVEFVLATPQGEKILTCEEPIAENRLTELLHRQLQTWGRDPFRQESFRRARLWVKELLFS